MPVDTPANTVAAMPSAPGSVAANTANVPAEVRMLADTRMLWNDVPSVRASA